VVETGVDEVVPVEVEFELVPFPKTVPETVNVSEIIKAFMPVSSN
jgi:hypothetical protein